MPGIEPVKRATKAKSAALSRRNKAAANAGQFKKGRRPHNKAPAPDIESLEELVAKLAHEPTRVRRNGELVEITEAERMIRLEVDDALKGNIPALKHLIRFMIDHPAIVRSTRSEVWIFINGPLADV